jgi:hypothetical protein
LLMNQYGPAALKTNRPMRPHADLLGSFKPPVSSPV